MSCFCDLSLTLLNTFLSKPAGVDSVVGHQGLWPTPQAWKEVCLPSPAFFLVTLGPAVGRSLAQRCLATLAQNWVSVSALLPVRGCHAVQVQP